MGELGDSPYIEFSLKCCGVGMWVLEYQRPDGFKLHNDVGVHQCLQFETYLDATEHIGAVMRSLPNRG